MAKQTLELLGVWENKEYYLELKTGNFFVRIPSIREAIRAEPGWVIVSADYSQIEVKIMAFLSQDPWLIQAINAKDSNGNGKDIHSFMCCEINGLDYEFFYDVKEKLYKHPNCATYTQTQLEALHHEFSEKRSNTKCVTFGVPYGAGVDTVARNIRIKDFVFPDGKVGLEPMERAKRRAQELMDSYFLKGAVLKMWLDEQKTGAIEEERTFSIIGRSRWYVVPDPDDPERKIKLASIGREAGNQPIQSSNADILKIAVDLFYRKIRGGILNGPNLYGGARILMVVHDEIVVTCPEEFAYTIPREQAEKILADDMSSQALKDSVIGPVPKLLKECMEEAYNSISKEIKGKVCHLRDIYNPVDVVIGDYWSKE